MVSLVLQITGDEIVVYLYCKIFISLSISSLHHVFHTFISAYELMKALG